MNAAVECHQDAHSQVNLWKPSALPLLIGAPGIFFFVGWMAAASVSSVNCGFGFLRLSQGISAPGYLCLLELGIRLACTHRDFDRSEVLY